MGAKKEKKRGWAKERNSVNLFNFLSNPDNKWPRRQDYSIEILGYKKDNQIYTTLSPDDITKIENDALEAIKSQSGRQRRDIYKALYDEAKGGNVHAAKEFLDRTEGKIADKKEHTGKGGGPIEVKNVSIDVSGAKEAFNG